MPNLPTFTVTDTVAQRLLAAFEGQEDETGAPLTAVQAYKRWLRSSLTHYVLEQELRQKRDALQDQLPL